MKGYWGSAYKPACGLGHRCFSDKPRIKQKLTWIRTHHKSVTSLEGSRRSRWVSSRWPTGERIKPGSPLERNQQRGHPHPADPSPHPQADVRVPWRGDETRRAVALLLPEADRAGPSTQHPSHGQGHGRQQGESRENVTDRKRPRRCDSCVVVTWLGLDVSLTPAVSLGVFCQGECVCLAPRS